MPEDDPILQEIKAKLKDMTEEQKQKVLDILWKRPSMICQKGKQVV